MHKINKLINMNLKYPMEKTMDHHRSSIILKMDMGTKWMINMKIINRWRTSNRTQVLILTKYSNICLIGLGCPKINILVKLNFYKTQMRFILKWIKRKILNHLRVLSIKMLMGRLTFRSAQTI